MLYQWLEIQRALWRSLNVCTDFAPTQNPPGVQASVAPLIALPGYGWLYPLMCAAQQPPPFNISSVDINGQQVAIEERVVDVLPFCTLRRFARIHFDETSPSPKNASPPTARILLCAPLAGHHAVMLRETVETLLQNADVYVTDWANARDVPLSAGHFDLDEYVLTIKRFIDTLSAHTPHGGIHLIAVCQATVPSLAAAALLASEHGKRPLSLTLMGGPIDTRIQPTLVDQFALSHRLTWFRDTMIDTAPAGYPGVGRRVYPGHIQHAAIVAAHPHRQLALETRYWLSHLSADHRAAAAQLRALNEYTAVLDMTEDYFLDTLRVIFQEHHLARGVWRVKGQHVCPNTLAATALCTVEGELDDITGAGQTHAAHTLCGASAHSLRARLTIKHCDHYDLFTGARWREEIYPQLTCFWQQVEDNASRTKPPSSR